MARPRTTFTDDQLRSILAATADADACAPAPRNAEFLDLFIAGVARATGRLYGQPVYERLLGAASIARRPSATTWMAAIDRAREVCMVLPGTGTPIGAVSSAAVAVQVATRPVTVPAVAPPAGVSGEATGDLTEWKTRVTVAEATARDAYARLAALDAGRVSLIERAAAAEARARAVTDDLERQRRDHENQTSALLARVDALVVACDRLSGMERHLRLQTDTLRQEMAQQVQGYRARTEAAEKALAIERSQTDAMRRVLGNRAVEVPDSPDASGSR